MEEIYEVGNDIEAQREISREENDHGEIAETEVDVVADFIKKRLAKVPGEPLKARSMTIFRLPGWFHEISKELCEPKMVAIGPYHHGKEGLRTMEEHKWSTLRDFLTHNENVGLEVYLQAMRSIEVQARHCYSETVDLGSDDFVMMLLLDGCFILEWFFNNDSHEKDAICNVGWAENDTFADMFLLENQLPFFVIHELLFIRDQGVGWTQNCEDHCPLLNLIFESFSRHHFVSQFKPPKISSCSDIYHWLDLYYTATVPDFQPQAQRKQGNFVPGKSRNFCGLDSFRCFKLFTKSVKADSESSEQNVGPMFTDKMNIQCVSELHDAGIKFKTKNKPHNMLDISFENGTIEMPFLQIQNTVITVLWNMVAFEQSRRPWGLPQTLSSYLALMDSLINTEKDVAILEQSGIVESYFQNAEEAALFFNQFDKIFVLDYSDHYFLDFFKDVQRYSESSWHKYRARLMHDYFSNPWSIISVLAAAILLILTFVQTYYSAAK